jgi:CrcB protein
MNMLIPVAMGGALGSIARYVFAGQVTRLAGGAFPWGIMATNVLGSFVMGVLVEAFAQRWSVGAEMRAFLTVGVLGGFTTFSSFSLDSALLLQKGDHLAAAAYMIGSVILSVAALFAGLALVRTVLA